MNKVVLMGRLTKDPIVSYTQKDTPLCIAKYTLAVNGRAQKGGEEHTDFINCTAFGKSGEFAEKYFHKGIKILVTGRINTGSYTNKEGQKVYTTDVIVDEQEFAESKSANSTMGGEVSYGISPDGFTNIPPIPEEDIPFT